MTFVDWLSSTFGTTVVLAALVGAFWKIILNRITADVNKKLKQDLITYKDQLDRSTALAIKDVEIKANERAIKLSKVFEKQAEVIATLYQMLLPIVNTLELYTNFRRQMSDENRHREMNKFINYCDSFFKAFRPNKIYIPPATANQIESLMSQIFGLVHIIQLREMVEEPKPKSDFSYDEEVEKQMEIFNRNISPLLTSLESDFQRILGFPDDKPASELTNAGK